MLTKYLPFNGASCEELIDELGEVQSRLTALRTYEADLKRRILMTGPADHVRGEAYEATLITIGPSSKTEWKSVAIALKPTKALVDRYTKQIEPYTQFRLYPREA